MRSSRSDGSGLVLVSWLAAPARPPAHACVRVRVCVCVCLAPGGAAQPPLRGSQTGAEWDAHWPWSVRAPEAIDNTGAFPAPAITGTGRPVAHDLPA